MRILADLVAVLHLLVVLSVCAAVPAAYHFPRLRMASWVYLLGIVICSIPFRACPLTWLERILRARFHPQGLYAGGFVNHYSKRFIGLHIASWFSNTVIGLVLVILLALDFSK